MGQAKTKAKKRIPNDRSADRHRPRRLVPVPATLAAELVRLAKPLTLSAAVRDAIADSIRARGGMVPA
jgi:hypothetical protein